MTHEQISTQLSCSVHSQPFERTIQYRADYATEGAFVCDREDPYDNHLFLTEYELTKNKKV